MDRILSPFKNDINMFSNSIFLHREHIVGDTGPQPPSISLPDPFVVIRKRHEGYTGPEIIHNLLDGFTGHTGLQGETGPTGSTGPAGSFSEDGYHRIKGSAQGLTGASDVVGWIGPTGTSYGTYDNTSGPMMDATGHITILENQTGYYFVHVKLAFSASNNSSPGLLTLILKDISVPTAYLRSDKTIVTPTGGLYQDEISITGIIYIDSACELELIINSSNLTNDSIIVGLGNTPNSTITFQKIN